MKRFLTTLLVGFLLLPACGSASAYSVGHEAGQMESHMHDMGASKSELADSVVPADTLSGISDSHHPHLGTPASLNCCGSEHDGQYLGQPEPRPTEKVVSVVVGGHPFVTSTASFHWLDRFANNPPTAPPIWDRWDYAALVGIVKSLN